MVQATVEIPVGTELTGEDQPISITVRQRTWGVDEWVCRLPRIDTSIVGLTQGRVLRDGVELIRGKILKPRKSFGRGTTMDLPGLGYANEVNRFITGAGGTISELTVSAAIQEVLDNSPSVHGITLGTVDTFYPVKQPNLIEFDTTVEFHQFTYSDVGLEYDPATKEVDGGQPDGATTNLMPRGWLRNSFVDIRGTIFVYWVDGTNNVYYSSSTDGGTTWAAKTDTTYNANASAIIDVTYNPASDFVHLAVYTGAATAFYTGTISGGTVTHTLKLADIFSANRSPRHSFIYETTNDHLWVIDSANHLWVSDNEGSAWTDKGVLTETGKFVFPFPAGATGDDMYLVEYDAANDVLELWKWDDGVSTETKVKDIYDFGAAGDIMQYLTGTVGHDGSMHITCNDDADNVHYFMIDTSLTITTVTTAEGATLQHDRLSIMVDNGDSAYVLFNRNTAVNVIKYTNGVLISSTTGYGTSGYNVQSPIKNKVGFNDNSGLVLTGGDDAGAQTVELELLSPSGIRLSRGHTTGTFHTTTITADGDFERWGVLSGLQTAGGDITYDVEDGAGVDYATGMKLDADMYASGVTTSDTTIVIEGTITKTGTTEPMLQELYVNERWTKVDGITYDSEKIGSWLDKLKKIVGGEWDLSTSNVLTFVDELGTDHSATVTLEEGVNCESIVVEDAFDSYANIVLVTDGASITQIIRNSAKVTADGEYWHVIRDPEMNSNGLAWNRGSVGVVILSVGPKRITAHFMDDQSKTKIAETLTRGDTVTVKSPKTGTTQTARIIELTRIYAGAGEKVTAILVNAGRAQGLIDYWAELEDIRRQI